MSIEMDNISLQQKFEEVIASEEKLSIQEFLNNQNISDVANLIYENHEYESQIISHLSIHRAASVFKILESAEQKRIIEDLPPFKSAELLNELPADDRVAFLEALPNSVVREMIKTLDPDERKITLELLGYPENSVGRIMTPDYVYVYEYNTVKEVIETIRRFGTNSETIDVIYVINYKGELLDDIRIREIILASPEEKVSELMDGRFISLNANDDQELANEAFKMNNRVALPVTDNSNILLGIITIDDVLWIEPYLDISIFRLLKKRAGWLVLLFLGEMLTASAMQYFQHEIETATVLALFIPLIMSSGGNSGSQASTLIIQAMALGELTVTDWWKVMRRELITGMMLGIILGSIGLLRIFIWQNLHVFDYGVHWNLLALTIFFSLMGIVLWGSLMGSMLPIILKRMKLDPAASSAPFVATLVDVTGIVIYFSVAYFFLKGIML